MTLHQDISEEQIQHILEVLDNAIQTGPWEQSGLLKVIGKNLKKMREDFAESIASPHPTERSPIVEQSEPIPTDMQSIYISLYAHEGRLLQTWERLLSTLPKQLISRPIYENQADIEFLIRSKENKLNEAYIEVKIKKTDILPRPADKIIHDRFDKPLLTLKDNAVALQNIIRFVHVSGDYHYVQGKLIAT